MYTAATEIRFRARHAVKIGHEPIEPMHEHDWRVRAVVQTDRLDENGLVIDFYLLKKWLRDAVEPLSQCESINALPDFQAGSVNPSTERIARYIFDKLSPRLPASLTLTEIIVWETADCRAGYAR